MPLTSDASNVNMDEVTTQIMSEWETEPNNFGEEQASSSDSSVDSVCCSSPEMFCPCGSQGIELSFGYSGRRAQSKGLWQSKSKMSIKRRMKASEREKMRMRSLAEALHQLRDYLPPYYSKKGQPLTKIQTLKYTIEYINKLSDILSHA